MVYLGNSNNYNSFDKTGVKLFPDFTRHHLIQFTSFLHVFCMVWLSRMLELESLFIQLLRGIRLQRHSITLRHSVPFKLPTPLQPIA